MAKILVGLSGGVDSAVVVALLKSQGHEVIGYTLKLFESISDESEGCCTFKDIRDATLVCDSMGIEHIVSSWKHSFKQNVVDRYVDGVKQGVSFNPCVTCNSTIKLPVLVAVANHFGCDYVATGHYARITNGKISKAKNLAKDQSYFLWQTPIHLLHRFLFPLGEIESKTDTRAIAREFGLHVATKPDSTDLCFFEGGTKQEFFERNGIQDSPGNIVDASTGKVLGHHQGHHQYTSGQRVRLPGLPGPRYVLKVVPEANEVKVDTREMIECNSVELTDVVLHGNPVEAVMRYHSKPVAVESFDGKTLKLKETFFAPTSGQSCVFYENDVVVGGGIIR